MSGHEIFDIDGLAARVKSARERAARLQTLRDRVQGSLEATRAEVGVLSSQILLKSKVEELFRALMDALVVKQVKAIESLVTEGLQTIFHDQRLSFESEVRPKYNKVSIEFFIRQVNARGIEVRGKPLESFGGGPSSVASLLLRILTLLRLKRYPVLLLDETLAAVSDEYVDNTGRFLQILSKKMGVTILMITHMPTYLDHATSAYKGQEVEDARGDRYLQLKKVQI